MSALDELDPRTRAVVSQVLGRRSPELLARLSATTEVDRSQRERVERCLSDEFHSHPLGPEYEPSDEAREIDDALGRFLLRFPVERSS